MMLRKASQTVLIVLALSLVAMAQVKSDKEHNGLLGNIHTIKTEVAKISIQSGNLTEGKRELRRTETYDQKGNMTERIGYMSTAGTSFFADKNGKAASRQVFIHGKNGDRVEYSYPITDRSDIQLESRDGRMDGSWRINWFLKFDSSGNRIEEEVARSEGTHMYKNVYTYDNSGRKTEMFHHEREKSLSSKSVYSYDDKGSISEMALYKADGTLKERLKYGYEYDQIGNWVKRLTLRVVSKDGQEHLEAVEIAYRTITYYP